VGNPATAIDPSSLLRHAVQAAVSQAAVSHVWHPAVFPSLNNLQTYLNLAQNIACGFWFNLLAPEFLRFLILAHPVNKMWIIQEPNTLESWNKLHFKRKQKEIMYHV
jgi:hypothetical protein